jgi:hypothetical protein
VPFAACSSSRCRAVTLAVWDPHGFGEDAPLRLVGAADRRVAAMGGGAADLGRSCGGLTTKIHVLVDGRGRALGYLLTPGQAAAGRHAEPLLEGVAFARLIGDAPTTPTPSAPGAPSTGSRR